MIEVKHLSKFFGPHKAVDRIAFTVQKGEILGFLGPNGAGKSTTMRMITGFVPPSGGTAVIGGHDILREPVAARKKIGYLPENAPVYPDMTVYAYLDFCAQIRGFSGSDRKRRVTETIEKCFLSGVEHQTVSTLSKGFKQRVCFAQSILHDPEYLILDEPTDGLDPNQKHEVRLMIRKMSAEKAIILSTHILDEVEAVCSRAVIITKGAIVADDTPENLKARSTIHGAISVTLADADADAFIACARSVPGIREVAVIERTDGALKARIYPESADPLAAEHLMTALSAKRFEVKSLFVEQGRLDEVFRAVTTS
ncbi:MULTISPECIES: ABC transporter ATP-binding protein [Desulfococcus]|uniref:ABC transporter related protein n=1 Tax=Desulfococcus multivorans DSM 2059 TaxID=1121405 RepID=S7VD51_DESML|nr:ATP-binding cassette domain-containing protein [Desulfococcus multivorans]AOY60234.1 putative ABC transporter, ATP-binding protein [Desulfococcus multivorans]AQV02348.1 ABC transporter ATP-binding protein [Desulfococcus multivorans]EPR44624.1 ABC transporter related protein [Desulfococcus multivorans DSM 2059]SKA07316.1 ABC-2 type transport system ATP-binding protein [Desulfococcus multivorans DSM 2059]